jgi:cbb3-type cytochrome oxidase subunit 1
MELYIIELLLTMFCCLYFMGSLENAQRHISQVVNLLAWYRTFVNCRMGDVHDGLTNLVGRIEDDKVYFRSL